MPGVEHGGDDGPSPEAVTIERVRLLGSFRGRVMVEWSLSTEPGSRWAGAFAGSPSKRRGSPEFVTDRGGPEVVPEGLIRWSVPHGDLRGAAAFVLESVIHANAAVTGGDRRSSPPDGPSPSAAPAGASGADR